MKLSAVYLVKNEEEFIGKSIQSVVDDCHEVIVVNNQSTDGTKGVVDSVSGMFPGKVKWFEHDTNFDVSCEYNERNRAIKHACGDWFLILDADQIMSDGWRQHVDRFLVAKGCDAVRVRYEHLVGSYEYIHKSFYEKQHGSDKHPDVPLWQTVLFRRTHRLLARPASDSCPQFKPYHHARFDESVAPGKMWDCNDATVFHYGFAKRDMMHMSKYRIGRGDYGHEEDRKADLIRQLDESGNAFKFIGSVQRVDYGPEFVPTVMRDAFDRTYDLVLDEEGFILERKLKA